MDVCKGDVFLHVVIQDGRYVVLDSAGNGIAGVIGLNARYDSLAGVQVTLTITTNQFSVIDDALPPEKEQNKGLVEEVEQEELQTHIPDPEIVSYADDVWE